MRGSIAQNSLEPSATMTLRVALDEYGLPVAHRAGVIAAMTRPDGSTGTLTLTEVQDGIFEVSTVATQSGVYRFHVVASGVTLRGKPFTREQLLTAAVFLGGNHPLPHVCAGCC